MKTIIAFTLILFFALNLYAQDFKEPIPAENTRENDSLRDRIKAFVWGGEARPTITKDESDTDYLLKVSDWVKYPELASYEVYTVHLNHGFTSKIYLFHPVISNGLKMPVIYHSGHGLGIFREDYEVNGTAPYGISMIQTFLRKGYDVIGIDMPLYVNNKFPSKVVVDGVEHSISTHDDMAVLENPLYYFLAPINTTLDYFEEKYGFHRYVMMGLSGGGWATTVYSAMDTRIQLSFPVAGSIPLPLRTPRDEGDFEQWYPQFYNEFNYSTLYYLGATGRGRLQYQVLIKQDNCCFAWNGWEYWVPDVRDKILTNKTRGSFRFLYDTITPYHKFSSVSGDSIQHYVDRYVGRYIRDNVKISANNSQTILCDHGSLAISVSDIGNNTVEWYKGGEFLAAGGSTITIKDSGLYYARIRNVSGVVAYSDSLKINLIGTPVVSQINDELVSSLADSIQWYYNGHILAGATARSYFPTAPGNYSVKTVLGNCSKMSEQFAYKTLVYPNPVSNQLHLDFAHHPGNFRFQLLNSAGMMVKSGLFSGHKILDVAAFQRGLYILSITGDHGFSINRKIIVH